VTVRDDERRPAGRVSRSVRIASASALAGSAAIGLLVASACLPDLAPLPSRDVAEPPLVTGCGDGFIETLDDGGDAGESCDPGDADVPGCESCHFTCSGRIDDAGHCYFFAEPTSSYGAAVNACNAAGGHVVTFASEREVAFATSLVKEAHGDVAYWVGLSIRTDLGGGEPYGPPSGVAEPGWPTSGLACSGCYAFGVDDAGAFQLHPEVDASARADCLVHENGTWLRTPCTGTREHVTLCEREPVGERGTICEQNICTTIPATVGRKRYVIGTQAFTAQEAADYCRNVWGASLVMFDSREEREQLVREMRENRRGLPPGATVWIGLSYEDGRWVWDDGVPVEESARPLPWAGGQPADAGAGRAFLDLNDRRFDTQLAHSDDGRGEDARRAFVCQR